MTSDRLFVFDTNTLISAALIEGSKPQRALLLALRLGSLVFSRATLEELYEVLLRQRFDRYLTRVERLEFLEGLLRRSILVDVPEDTSVSRDPDDDKFLSVAVAARVGAIVTGDKDLLVLHPFWGIPVLTPHAFLTVSEPPASAAV